MSLLFFLFFCCLEILKLLNSSNFLFLHLVFSAICQCSISSSCDIDSALSVSVSCNTSLAILTLLEAILQHFCSSTLCLQQGRGSTLDSVSAEAIVKAQRHVSLQIFLQHLFFLPSIRFTCPGISLHSVGHCIPMSHESSLESSCSNVQLISTVHSAVLRHMLFGIFVQPCSYVSSEPWHQSSSRPYLFHFHRNV